MTDKTKYELESEENLKKVRVVTRKISFLMHHQEILPDLKEIATQLYPLGEDPEGISRNSSEYLLGAYEALMHLIVCLEQKGPCIK